MVLPVIHALHRRHPDARLRVLTHQPGDVLLQHDPAVTAVVRAERGRERAAVLAELDRWRPDLVVTTTRYDGIADAIEELAPQSVTNLWRSPPPDEPVSARYLRILASEHVIDPATSAWCPASCSPTPSASRASRCSATRAAGRSRAGGGDGGQAVAALAAAGDGAGRPRVSSPASRRCSTPGAAARPGCCRRCRCAASRRCSPRSAGGAGWSSAATPARCGWPRPSGRAPSGSSARPLAARYGLGPPGVDLQGLPDCPHRRPTAITEQVCWWEAHCPLSSAGPACMADVTPDRVLELLPVPVLR